MDTKIEIEGLLTMILRAMYALMAALALVTTGILAAFKVVEGYDWSWWSVSSPLVLVFGVVGLVYLVVHSLNYSKAVLEEERKHLNGL